MLNNPHTIRPLYSTLALSLGLALSVGSAVAYADDLIVDGRACIGEDCVDFESFLDPDTLRLKQNNIYIHADDTSDTASYPANDWRLIFNDSANGGANKFSIEDATGNKIPFTIEAGARDNALYVDDLGNVGLGTNTPVMSIHTVDGDTPTLRLEQNGSSGWTPQIWDVAGNEYNFFIRDQTNGTTLPFRIQTGSPEDSIYIKQDKLLIKADNLTVNSAENAEVLKVEPTLVTITPNLLVSGDITVESDGRFKTQVKTISAAQDQIRGLDGKQYRWLPNERHNDKRERMGFIAQEVEAVLPQLVSENDEGVKSVNYLGVIPVLVNALKEQMHVTDNQAMRIEMLTEELASQRILIEQLLPSDTAVGTR